MKPMYALPLLLMIAGCGAGGSGDASAAKRQAAGGAAAASAEASASKREATADLPRKIIYTGNISLACENLDRASEGLLALVRRFDGYIGDAHMSGARGAVREGSWTVRVPSERFDAFLAALPGLGELESTARQAQDVSEEFYDAEARLRNKRVEETRLIDLLKRAGTNLDAVLRVERELSRVREEIETIEGRLRFLGHQSDLSTVTITLHEAKTFAPVGPPTLKTRVERTFGGSVDALKESGTAILLFLVAIAPWVLPITVLGFIVDRLRRRLRLFTRAVQPTPPPRVEP